MPRALSAVSMVVLVPSAAVQLVRLAVWPQSALVAVFHSETVVVADGHLVASSALAVSLLWDRVTLFGSRSSVLDPRVPRSYDVVMLHCS